MDKSCGARRHNRLAAPRHQWHASRMTSKCIPLKALWWRSY
jgi:hypothetical protein